MPISNYHYVLCLIIGSKLPLERKQQKQIERHKPFLATNSTNDKLKTILEELKPLPYEASNDDDIINSISILKEQSEKILQLQKVIDTLLAQGTKYLSNVM